MLRSLAVPPCDALPNSLSAASLRKLAFKALKVCIFPPPVFFFFLFFAIQSWKKQHKQFAMQQKGSITTTCIYTLCFCVHGDTGNDLLTSNGLCCISIQGPILFICKCQLVNLIHSDGFLCDWHLADLNI